MNKIPGEMINYDKYESQIEITPEYMWSKLKEVKKIAKRLRINFYGYQHVSLGKKSNWRDERRTRNIIEAGKGHLVERGRKRVERDIWKIVEISIIVERDKE